MELFSLLPKGAGGSKEGMRHTQPFGDGPLLSQLSESTHLWLPFLNFSGHENHSSIYEKCAISDCNSRDVLKVSGRDEAPSKLHFEK